MRFEPTPHGYVHKTSQLNTHVVNRASYLDFELKSHGATMVKLLGRLFKFIGTFSEDRTFDRPNSSPVLKFTLIQNRLIFCVMQ